jgi:hypothetical protein
LSLRGVFRVRVRVRVRGEEEGGGLETFPGRGSFTQPA